MSKPSKRKRIRREIAEDPGRQVRTANYRLKIAGLLWFDGPQPQDPGAQVTYQLNPNPQGQAEFMQSAEWLELQTLTEAELRARCEALPRPSWAK